MTTIASKMTPEAQRIAIGEACWWEKSHDRSERVMYREDPPDYLNDLNAMHEAEKVLDDFGTYTDILRSVTGKQPQIPGPTSFVWHATAAQRAEAFLKTLGLWKEEVVSDTKVA